MADDSMNGMCAAYLSILHTLRPVTHAHAPPDHHQVTKYHQVFQYQVSKYTDSLMWVLLCVQVPHACQAQGAVGPRA